MYRCWRAKGAHRDKCGFSFAAFLLNRYPHLTAGTRAELRQFLNGMFAQIRQFTAGGGAGSRRMGLVSRRHLRLGWFLFFQSSGFRVSLRLVVDAAPCNHGTIGIDTFRHRHGDCGVAWTERGIIGLQLPAKDPGRYGRASALESFPDFNES